MLIAKPTGNRISIEIPEPYNRAAYYHDAELPRQDSKPPASAVTASSSTIAVRALRVCDACRVAHKKCNGQHKCGTCERTGRKCTYTDEYSAVREHTLKRGSQNLRKRKRTSKGADYEEASLSSCHSSDKSDSGDSSGLSSPASEDGNSEAEMEATQKEESSKHTGYFVLGREICQEEKGILDALTSSDKKSRNRLFPRAFNSCGDGRLRSEYVYLAAAKDKYGEWAVPEDCVKTSTRRTREEVLARASAHNSSTTGTGYFIAGRELSLEEKTVTDLVSCKGPDRHRLAPHAFKHPMYRLNKTLYGHLAATKDNNGEWVVPHDRMVKVMTTTREKALEREKMRQIEDSSSRASKPTRSKKSEDLVYSTNSRPRNSKSNDLTIDMETGVRNQRSDSTCPVCDQRECPHSTCSDEAEHSWIKCQYPKCRRKWYHCRCLEERFIIPIVEHIHSWYCPFCDALARKDGLPTSQFASETPRQRGNGTDSEAWVDGVDICDVNDQDGVTRHGDHVSAAQALTNVELMRTEHGRDDIIAAHISNPVNRLTMLVDQYNSRMIGRRPKAREWRLLELLEAVDDHSLASSEPKLPLIEVLRELFIAPDCISLRRRITEISVEALTFPTLLKTLLPFLIFDAISK